MSACERFTEQCSRMFAGATLLLCLAAPSAFAAPITYTFSGPVSGTLGATSFTNAQITVVATGDTSTADCGAPMGRSAGVHCRLHPDDRIRRRPISLQTHSTYPLARMG
jgi:hypothetical protein